jgi:hypothetical protein
LKISMRSKGSFFRLVFERSGRIFVFFVNFAVLAITLVGVCCLSNLEVFASDVFARLIANALIMSGWSFVWSQLRWCRACVFFGGVLFFVSPYCLSCL